MEAEKATGIAEVSQGEIEKRAGALARQAGREQPDESDLKRAHDEVLGVSSEDSAHLPTSDKQQS